MISRIIQLTLIFAVACAGIMVCFGYDLGHLIYNSKEAGMFIRMMAPLIPVMYFDHIVDGILKGMGEQLYTMRVNIFDSLMSVILVYYLIPIQGIFGYVIIIYTMEIVNTSLSVVRLLKCSCCYIDIINWVIKPLICIIGATSIQKILLSFDYFYAIPASQRTVLGVSMTIVIYVILLRITFSFDKEDAKWLYNAIR